MKKKAWIILNALAFAITIVINYISNTGMIGGNTMKSVSDRYQNLFTPASYAFSIWGIIYLLLAAFIIYSFAILKKERQNNFITQISFWFIASCIANSLWVFAWLNDHITVSVLLMVMLLITLMKIIVNTKIGIGNTSARTIVFLWWPFSLYAGWISVALIANTAVLFTKLQWNAFGISESAWAIIMIVVAGVLNVFITLKKDLNAFAIAGAWGLVAVALNNKEVDHSVFIAGLMTAALITVCILINLVKFFRRCQTENLNQI